MLLRAIIVSIMCMVSGNYNFMLFGPTLPAYVLGKPLIGGLIVGLLYGDVHQGLIIGCALQIGYLSYMVVAGGHSADQGFISYPIIAIALISHLDTGAAMAIGATVAALVASYYSNTLKALNVFPSNALKKAIHEGNYKKIQFDYCIWPSFNIFILRFVPSFILVWWGAGIVESVVSAMPAFLLHGLSKFGSFMPAVGIALLMKVTIKETWNIAFMLLGFTLYAYLGMNMLGACVIAGCAAIFYYLLKTNASAASVTTGSQETQSKEDEEVL